MRPNITKVIRVSKIEVALVVSLVILYLCAMYVHISTILVFLGMVLGGWLVFRPSEWAVEGLEGISKTIGLTAYFVGVLTSLTSNLPEAVMLGLTLWRGYTTKNPAMVDIAILTVLSSIGFNMMLLGSVILLGTKKTGGSIEIPKTAIEHEIELIRFTIVALLAVFALGIIDILFSMNLNETTVTTYYIPREATLLLVISYLIYILFAAKGGVQGSGESEKTKEELHYSTKAYTMLFLAGLLGIYLGGELIVRSVESIISEEALAIYGNPIILSGLLMGALAAVPEHGIAVISAHKGKIDISLGNLLGGISQIILLILGSVGTIILIPLDEYVLFQLLITALCMWFLKRSIVDDGKLDNFEGIMIITVQIFVFILLLKGLV
ncbi:MAG: hypothetical protein ACTSXW_08800 [Candidatus Baldrarchaeia archaeon]